jgi:hypothetical protein
MCPKVVEESKEGIVKQIEGISKIEKWFEVKDGEGLEPEEYM